MGCEGSDRTCSPLSAAQQTCMRSRVSEGGRVDFVSLLKLYGRVRLVSGSRLLFEYFGSSTGGLYRAGT